MTDVLIKTARNVWVVVIWGATGFVLQTSSEEYQVLYDQASYSGGAHRETVADKLNVSLYHPLEELWAFENLDF